MDDFAEHLLLQGFLTRKELEIADGYLAGLAAAHDTAERAGTVLAFADAIHAAGQMQTLSYDLIKDRLTALAERIGNEANAWQALIAAHSDVEARCKLTLVAMLTAAHAATYKELTRRLDLARANVASALSVMAIATLPVDYSQR